jgi:3-oxoacyl-[acyl-carrier-protein] synthase-3
MKSFIKHISYHLPENILTNEELGRTFPGWNIDELCLHTGVSKRHIASKDETPSDLAVKAAEKLFADHQVDRNCIDFILYCTVSSDYVAPTTACVIQEKLNIPKSTGALDFNHGCSGFVYGLALAEGLIASGIASNVLLLTSEAISKYIHPKDKSSRFLFGDAAAATLIVNRSAKGSFRVGKFVLGTDGKGYSNIMIKYGAARHPLSEASDAEITDEYGNVRTEKNFYMNGNAVFLFSISMVPKMITKLLENSHCSFEDIDYFIFHQANKIILDTLRKKMNIPPEKMILEIKDFGNTVSSTIPIALMNSSMNGKFKKGDKILLAAFGVGYSWASTIIEVV